jgi:hypothetical protein
MCHGNQNRTGRATSSHLCVTEVAPGLLNPRWHGRTPMSHREFPSEWCRFDRRGGDRTPTMRPDAHHCTATCDSRCVETRHRHRASPMARHVHRQPPIQNMVVKSQEDRCASSHGGLWGCLEHLNQIVQRVIERAATRRRTDGVMRPTESRASQAERSLVKGDR